ncbi:MAG: c-type cytochrome [Rhodobacteraceae bacterium]|nr:c-type cytochrome [Paracoccaceae bacterium]
MTRFKSALVVVALLLPPVAQAQQMTLGEAEFVNSCAQCHGLSGTGDGVLAGYLNTPLPDLTGLQAANGGVFPVSYIYRVIEGGATVGAHGTREMPAWGQRYSYDANRVLGMEHSEAEMGGFVRGRILALIEYIASIQVE